MQKQYQVIDKKLVTAPFGTRPTLSVYNNPDEIERRFLIETLNLDEHTLICALDPDELSRLEFEPEHIALIIKRPKNYSVVDQFDFKVSSMGAFLFKEFLLVVTPEELSLSNGDSITKVATPAGLLLKIIYRCIVHFREHLKAINTIGNEIQVQINKSMSNTYLINLFELEKSLVYYLNFINSNGFLIEKMKANANKIGFTVDEMEILDDIYIENMQCAKEAEIYSNIFASLMDARASIVSNNLNVLMKTLNIVTIAIMVPTLVVSAFSMNVRIPLGDVAYAFWMIMGLAFVSVVIVMILFRSAK